MTGAEASVGEREASEEQQKATPKCKGGRKRKRAAGSENIDSTSVFQKLLVVKRSEADLTAAIEEERFLDAVSIKSKLLEARQDMPRKDVCDICLVQRPAWKVSQQLKETWGAGRCGFCVFDGEASAPERYEALEAAGWKSLVRRACLGIEKSLHCSDDWPNGEFKRLKNLVRRIRGKPGQGQGFRPGRSAKINLVSLSGELSRTRQRLSVEQRAAARDLVEALTTCLRVLLFE